MVIDCPGWLLTEPCNLVSQLTAALGTRGPFQKRIWALKSKWSYDHLISTMGFPILVRWYLYIESGPWFFTHWGWEKMDAILQTTFSNTFSSIKMFEFLLNFHWSLFLMVQLTISQYWFQRLGAEQATSHYLNQRWTSYMMHMCCNSNKLTRGECDKTAIL